MLDRMTWVQQVKIRLGYPVVNLAITDEMIETQIDFAIKKVIPYLNNIEVFDVGGKVTHFTEDPAKAEESHGEYILKKIYSVLRVSSNRDYGDVALDTAIYRNYVIYNNKSLVDTALWSYYCDSVTQDLAQIGFRFIGDTLYIDGGNSPYAVEAITDESINNMTEDYVNWCLDYTVALVKCIEGEIRSKVKITGSPVETNGSDLKTEGITEKKELEEKLGTSLGLFYATR